MFRRLEALLDYQFSLYHFPCPRIQPTQNPSSYFGNGRWKAPTANPTAAFFQYEMLFFYISRDRYTKVSCFRQSSSLQCQKSFAGTRQPHFCWPLTTMSGVLAAPHNPQQHLQTYSTTGESRVLPRTLNSAQKWVHTSRQWSRVPLHTGGCWFECGARCSASVRRWVQAGTSLLVLMGVFLCSPLGATKAVLRTKSPFVSKAAGQPLSGAYPELWSPGQGGMV